MELSQLFNLLLSWIGFGAIVGLISRTVLQVSDSHGVTTILMGIVGALFGCAASLIASPQQFIHPASGQGFCLGLVGSVVMLSLYRVLGEYWFNHRRGRRFKRNLGSDRRRRRRLNHLLAEQVDVGD